MNYRNQRTILLIGFCLILAAPSFAEPVVVCSGEAAGSYAAFPDVCRLDSGELYCVFYSGYGHVSLPKDTWPKGGRVMAVHSSDEGKSWSAPSVILDTSEDDRDPSVVQIPDGSLLCTWFLYRPDAPAKEKVRVQISRSTDRGKTWSAPWDLGLDVPYWTACSAPIRILPDGSLILGLYHENAAVKTAFGATIRSEDGGKTWKDFATIDENSGVRLDAETDILRLADGRLFAALRGDKVNMHYATSTDMGKTWSKVADIGFKGHCPYLLRHSSGMILLGVRIPNSAVYWSTDETATWKGPLEVDPHRGAYPSMVELKDGTVLYVFYEEGAGSSIRGARLRVANGEVKAE
jgi:hypothetical protein